MHDNKREIIDGIYVRQRLDAISFEVNRTLRAIGYPTDPDMIRFNIQHSYENIVSGLEANRMGGEAIDATGMALAYLDEHDIEDYMIQMKLRPQ